MKLTRLITGILLALSICAVSVSAQVSAPQDFARGTANIAPKEHNFFTFPSEKPADLSEAVFSRTPKEFYGHPEFGKVAYQTGCSNCAELVHKRTANSRYYIDLGEPSKFYIQQAYGPVHYRDAQGYWRSIDPRLRPADQPGVYRTPGQPNVFTINLKEDYTEAEFDGGKRLRYNAGARVLTLSGGSETDRGELRARPETSHAGADGVWSEDVFPGIDRQILFKRDRTKTNYVLKHKPEYAEGAEYFVIEERMTVPAGARWIRDASRGHETKGGYWKGYLLLVDAQGRTLAELGQAITYDVGSGTATAEYRVEMNGSQAVVRMRLRAEWLLAADRAYPVTLDPELEIRTSYPDPILYPTTANASLADVETFQDLRDDCWTPSEGICGPYVMDLALPRRSAITDVSFSYAIESKIRQTWLRMTFTFHGTDAEGDEFSSGPWTCSNTLEASNPGMCTADPADPFRYRLDGFTIESTCDEERTVPFEVRTYGCECGAGTECLDDCFETPADAWQMLVTGRTLEAGVASNAGSGSSITICTGESVNYTAEGQFGVPDYSYKWFDAFDGSAGTGDIRSEAREFNIVPEDVGVYNFSLEITDRCNELDPAVPPVVQNYEIIVREGPQMNVLSADTILCLATDRGSAEIEIVDSPAPIECSGATPGCLGVTEPLPKDFDLDENANDHSNNNAESTTGPTGASPFKGTLRAARIQYLYPQDIVGFLYPPGAPAEEKYPGKISAIAFYVTEKNTGEAFENFTIRMRCANGLNGITEFQPINDVVYGPASFSTTQGLNTIELDNAFVWDGESAILLEFCFENPRPVTDGDPDRPNPEIDRVSLTQVPNRDLCVMTSEPPDISQNVCELPAESTRDRFLNLRFIRCTSLQWYDDGAPSVRLTQAELNADPVSLRDDLAEGQYIANYVDPTGCTISDTFNVKVLADLDTLIKPACAGEANGAITILQPAGEDPNADGYRYQLLEADGVTEVAPFQESPLFENLAAGDYMIAVEIPPNARQCDPLPVTVREAPGVEIESIEAEVSGCGQAAQGSMTINVNAATGVPPYEYSIDGGATFGPDSVFPDIAAGTYNIVVRDANGCEATEERVVENEDSDLAINLEASEITPVSCAETDPPDGSILVAAMGGTKPYQFSIDDGATFQNDSLFTGLAGGQDYTVTVQDAQECTATAEFSDEYGVTAPEPFELQLVSSRNESCAGLEDGEIVLQLVGGNPPYTFGPDAEAVDQPPYEITLADLAPGDYAYDAAYATDANGCELSVQAAAQTVTVGPGTNVTLAEPADPVVCVNIDGETADGAPFTHDLGAALPDGETLPDGTWTLTLDGETQPTEEYIGEDNVFTPGFVKPVWGEYVVSLTAADGNGVEGACGSDPVTITLGGSEILNKPTETAFCQEDELELGRSSTPPGEWTADPPETAVIPGEDDRVNLAETPPGTYTLTFANDACPEQTEHNTYTFTVLRTPDASFDTPEPTSGEAFYARIDNIRFTNTTTDTLEPFEVVEDQPTRYTWNFGDGNNSALESPAHTYEKDGVYTVTLTVENPHETLTCSDEATAQVTVQSEIDMNIPTIITPNGDGVNDVLRLQVPPDYSLTFNIYNQWGQPAFEYGADGNTWDGSCNGGDCPEGVYFYVMQLKNSITGSELDRSGSITILR